MKKLAIPQQIPETKSHTPPPPVDKKGLKKWFSELGAKRSLRSIDHDIATGQIPCFRLGGIVLFDLDVVAAHFRARCKVNGNK